MSVLFVTCRFEECIETVQAVLDITWEELNTGHWSLVPESQRSLYAVASLLKVNLSNIYLMFYFFVVYQFNIHGQSEIVLAL